MKYNAILGTLEEVSTIGLGTWVFGGENWGGSDDKECINAVRTAIDQGVNFIDTAPFYSDGKSEALVGRAIKGFRDRTFIATKCGLLRENGRVKHDLSPYSINKEVDLSLQRLDCDVIDLYQCHWPDPNVPVEKTMETLFKLRSQGKIRHIGVSNFDLGLMQSSVKVAPVKTLQVQYSLLERRIETELVPFCQQNNIQIIAYGAMGGGILTGKYQKAPSQFAKSDARKLFYKYYEGAVFDTVQNGIQQLRRLDRPLNEIALNWVCQQTNVMTVLAGCRNAEQVRANVTASEWTLSDEDMAMVSQVRFF